MTKPLWEEIHDGWIDYIKFDLKQIEEFKQMLIENQYEDSAEQYRTIIKNLKIHLGSTLKEYEKKYGSRPPIQRLKKEMGL